LPEKPVILAFDDGYADLAEHAFPVLRAHGFTATVALVTGLLGQQSEWLQREGWAAHDLLSEDQVRYWAGEGIEFAAHSRTHPHLTEISDAELEEELQHSRADIARLTGTANVAFAYPYGEYGPRELSAVARHFDTAMTLQAGINCLGTDLLELRRTAIEPDDSIIDFALRVHFGKSAWQALRHRFSRVMTAFLRGATKDKAAAVTNC
jgi:peptidoglycan/xylan/chitin deacetylase (PgdA/CDA1 family)